MEGPFSPSALLSLVRPTVGADEGGGGGDGGCDGGGGGGIKELGGGEEGGGGGGGGCNGLNWENWDDGKYIGAGPGGKFIEF